MFKKRLTYTIIFVILILAIYFVTVKNEIKVFNDHDYEINVKIPRMLLLAGIIKNYEVLIYCYKKCSREFISSLLFNSFDRPLFFTYQEETDKLFVIYWYDIEDIVLTIGNVKNGHNKIRKITKSNNL